MKTRLIKSSCLLLCLVMLISGCSMYTSNTSFSKNAVEITPDNFLDYFDVSASFDNLSSRSVPFAPALTFFDATCTMHLKCTPKSNFEIDSVTADINFETDTMYWIEDKNDKNDEFDYTIKETLYINNNSTGSIDKVLTYDGDFSRPEIPTKILLVEVTSASGTIYI